jgi:RHS repeat-associated protein
MKKQLILFALLVFFGTGYSQNSQDIFKQNGYKKEMLTLTKGKFKETFYIEEIMQVGTVLINTKTNKVVKFLEEDNTDSSDISDTTYNAEHASRWLSPDPLSENDYWNSPYVFCNNNPIKYLDPDGRDYVLAFDEATKTVTVNATYYTNSASLESAQHAAAIINRQSGNFTYTVGKDDAAVSYTVNFNLSVVEVAGSEMDVRGASTADMSGQANAYLVKPDFDDANKNGGSSGNNIEVKESRQNSETGAHEMGHTLGLNHNTTGVMTEAQTDPNRSTNLQKSDVKDMISYPLRGKVNGAHNAEGRWVDKGKGTVVNNTGQTNNELKKGKVK